MQRPRGEFFVRIFVDWAQCEQNNLEFDFFLYFVCLIWGSGFLAVLHSYIEACTGIPTVPNALWVWGMESWMDATSSGQIFRLYFCLLWGTMGLKSFWGFCIHLLTCLFDLGFRQTVISNTTHETNHEPWRTDATSSGRIFRPDFCWLLVQWDKIFLNLDLN